MSNPIYADQAIMIYDKTSGVIMPSPVLTVSEVLGALAAYDPITGALGASAVTLNQLFTRQIQTVRTSFGTIGSALISLPITIDWPTAFADNNYTVMGQAVIGDSTSDGAVTSIINVASIELLPNGAGIIVTIANADSIPHIVEGHFFAIHD